MIIGKAHNWNALRRPTPSATHPLNRDPTKAPPKDVLTTRPSSNIKGNYIFQIHRTSLNIKCQLEDRVPSAMVLPLNPRSLEMLSKVSLTTLHWHHQK